MFASTHLRLIDGFLAEALAPVEARAAVVYASPDAKQVPTFSGGAAKAAVKAKSGHVFAGFDEGLAAVWESYNPLCGQRSQARPSDLSNMQVAECSGGGHSDLRQSARAHLADQAIATMDNFRYRVAQ